MAELKGTDRYPGERGNGFLSYVHADDAMVDGRITRLGDRLEKAIQLYCGEAFRIFRPSENSDWGDRWNTLIRPAFTEPTLMIPVITPAFLRNKICCKELLAFQSFQFKLRKRDFIIPIYYVDTEFMNNETARAGAVADVRAVVALLNGRCEDWRELRKKGEASRAYGEGVERIAKRAKEALYRLIQPRPLGKGLRIADLHQAGSDDR